MLQILQSLDHAACQTFFPACVEVAEGKGGSVHFFDVLLHQRKWISKVEQIENDYKLWYIKKHFPEILDVVRVAKDGEVCLVTDDNILVEQRLTAARVWEHRVLVESYPTILSPTRQYQLDNMIIQMVAPFLLMNFFRTINFSKDPSAKQEVLDNVHLLLSILTIKNPQHLEQWVIHTTTYKITKDTKGPNNQCLHDYIHQNFSRKRMGGKMVVILVEFERRHPRITKDHHFRQVMQSLK